MKKDNEQFMEHVHLIMVQERVSEKKARFIAWSEGAAGLPLRKAVRP
jgi:hypothetical protein